MNRLFTVELDANPFDSADEVFTDYITTSTVWDAEGNIDLYDVTLGKFMMDHIDGNDGKIHALYITDDIHGVIEYWLIDNAALKSTLTHWSISEDD